MRFSLLERSLSPQDESKPTQFLENWNLENKRRYEFYDMRESWNSPELVHYYSSYKLATFKNLSVFLHFLTINWCKCWGTCNWTVNVGLETFLHPLQHRMKELVETWLVIADHKHLEWIAYFLKYHSILSQLLETARSTEYYNTNTKGRSTNAKKQ